MTDGFSIRVPLISPHGEARVMHTYNLFDSMDELEAYLKGLRSAGWSNGEPVICFGPPGDIMDAIDRKLLRLGIYPKGSRVGLPPEPE